MKRIDLIFILFLLVTSCKVKKDVNNSQLNKFEYNKEALNPRPICLSENCDSIIYCYKNISELYQFNDENLKFELMVDCVYSKISQNKAESHNWLMSFYTGVYKLSQTKKIQGGIPYRMDDLRGMDAFLLALEFYKKNSIDPQYLAQDPSQEFRSIVIRKMIKKINGEETEVFENMFVAHYIDDKIYKKFKGLDLNKYIKNWWLNEYTQALNAGSIEFRQYGEDN